MLLLRFRKPCLIAALSTTLVGASLAAFLAPAAAQTAPPVWAQATSDLAPDPAVRFGQLENLSLIHI